MSKPIIVNNNVTTYKKLVLPRYIDLVIYVMTCSYMYRDMTQTKSTIDNSILYLLIINTEIHCLTA